MTLEGPYPLDLRAPGASVAAALPGRADAAGPSASAESPGLYRMWGEDGKLQGLWIVLGPSWVREPSVVSDREPPLAGAVFEALVEAVWWERLPVSRSAGDWAPLLVLEWSPALAWRSEAAPPGVRYTLPPTTDGAPVEDGGWLDAPAPPATPVTAQVEDSTTEVHLPLTRALLTVFRARLRVHGSRHEGSYELVFPPGPDWGPGAPPPSGERHGERHGEPRALPGGRVGWPLDGWLGRNLALLPEGSPTNRTWALDGRDLGARWRAQIIDTVGWSVGVTLGTLGLALLVGFLATPGVVDAPTPEPPAAHPALSVCSLDDKPFVHELRCQVRARAGSRAGAADCPQVKGGAADPFLDEDLRPAWCGLADRARDDSRRPPFHPAAEGAAQACFNVLNRPSVYSQAARPGRDGTADPAAKTSPAALAAPEALLGEGPLQVSALARLVEDLDEACDTYRTQLERQLEGAILATHVGTALGEDPDDEPEAARLRRLALVEATSGLRAPEQRCVEGGMASLLTGDTLGDLCGGRDELDAAVERKGAWTALAPEAPPKEPRQGAITGYVESRFVEGLPKDGLEDLWRCHLGLVGRLPRPQGKLAVAWGWSTRHAPTYSNFGLVQTQLLLDASVTEARGRTSPADPCWRVVHQALARYEPVHPTLPPVDPKLGFEPDTQVCAQACAAAYGVETSPNEDRWRTPGGDLSACTTAVQGDAPLTLPWNGADEAGVRWPASAPPTQAGLCGFHLLAEGYLGGDPPTLLEGVAPQDWAKAAPAAARDLARKNAPVGVSTCGFVAAQCFATGVLEILGTGGPRFQLPGAFDAWIEDVRSGDRTTRSPPKARLPWCELVVPYLPTTQADDEGDFAQTCAGGVEQTLVGFRALVDRLSKGTPP